MTYVINKTTALVCTIMLFLSACVVHSSNSLGISNSEAAYRERLIGAWTQKDVSPGATRERIVTFLVDGSYHSKAKVTKQKEVNEYQNRGSWSIENGVIYITVLESTRADIPLGCKTPNKIIVFTETELITESAEGTRTTAYRIRTQ